MNSDQWLRVKTLFDAAVELAPEQRPAYLEAACAGDEDLLREVRSLIDVDHQGSDFLEPPTAPAGGWLEQARTAGEKPAAERLSGQRIAHFLIGERLGVGGMGEVYAGFDEKLHRKVALKAIRSDQRIQAEAQARFLREARILSNLDHPNICRIYDYVESEGCDLLVLELIEGTSLRRALAEDLSMAEKLDVAESITDALTAAHAEGVVHRDLKPSNVMLTTDRVVKVLDFGLARLAGESEEPAPEIAGEESPIPGLELGAAAGSATRFHTAHGLVTGTPSAMSPEQLHGKEATPASDMYSVGLLLQELFTGQSAYDPDLDLPDLVQRARRGDTRPTAGIDRDLVALIERLKAPQAGDRATAAQARERLRWIRGKPRRRLRAGLLVGLAAVVILAAAKYAIDLRRERTAALEAREEADRRRGQAEDLIGFMLGDLRSKLEPIGKLEILDDVGAEALEYFAAVDQSTLSDSELHSRARALAQIGDVRIAQGDLEAAERAFAEALALSEDLAVRQPDNLDYLASLGAAQFWVGLVQWWRDDLDGAQGRFERYLAIAERLVAAEPDNLAWRMELSDASSNMGTILKSQGRPTAALAAFRRALELNRSAVAREPTNSEWLSLLADARSWVASTLAELGQTADALEENRLYQQTVLELARRHPDHAELRKMAADSHANVGGLLLDLKRGAEALDHFRRYETAYQDLVALDPTNNRWHRSLAVARRDLGRALVEAGDAPAAIPRLEAACEDFERLLEIDSTNGDWLREDAVCGVHLAAALLAVGRIAGAQPVIDRVVSRIEGQVVGAGEETEDRYLRARGFLVAGDVLRARRRAREALAAYQRAHREILELQGVSKHPVTLDLLAQTLIRLGREGEAKPILRRLREAGQAGSKNHTPGASRSTAPKEGT